MTIESMVQNNFNLNGIYRGLVEDNNDPLDSGRLKIRILGFHNFDGEINIEQLPWAKPALGLSWSGGYNVNNEDHNNGVANPDKGHRYDPGSNSKVSQTEQPASSYKAPNKPFQEEIIDPYSNACGTGGDFVVPKRGNWVFVFFEGGNHMNPIYFAMAPMERDWKTQKTTIFKKISDRQNDIKTFTKEYRDTSEPEKPNAESWAKDIVINTKTIQPTLQIKELDTTQTNRDIQSVTSSQGTTIVIDNRNGKEKIYVIHKNYIENTDEFGNRKIYVGREDGKKENPHNMELGVSGNYEIFVGGDFKLYPRGNVQITCEENAQIDVKKNVGIICREGDVDILVKKGNLNADIAGNMNAEIAKNANLHIKENANILVEKDLKATVNQNANLIVKQSLIASVDQDVSMKIKGKTTWETQEFNLICPDTKISGNVHINQKLNVKQDVNIAANCKIQGTQFITTGIDCGGFIKNKGVVDLGGPCTLHILNVIPGMGSGTGVNPESAQTAQSSDKTPTEASAEAGVIIDKKDLNEIIKNNENVI